MPRQQLKCMMRAHHNNTVSLILLLNTDSAVASLSLASPGDIGAIEVWLIDWLITLNQFFKLRHVSAPEPSYHQKRAFESSLAAQTGLQVSSPPSLHVLGPTIILKMAKRQSICKQRHGSSLKGLRNSPKVIQVQWLMGSTARMD